MQDLAQLIASAVATAINNKPEKERNNVRIPMPSTYNGERNAAVINLWIQEVERYLNFYDVPKTRWISYGVTLLRDRAQKWWNQLSQKNQESTTWEKFKVDLEYTFKPSYSEHAARDRLASVKQARLVAEYVDEFQDILLDLPRVSDDEALDRFVRGLKDDVRIHVMTKDPRSLEEAMRFAIAYDSAKQTGMFIPTNRQDQIPSDPMDLSVLIQQLNAMNMANNGHHQRERVPVRNNRNIICHWCKKSCHVIADCRTRLREVREFEQNRMRQNRGNSRQQFNRQRDYRQYNNNKVYHADLIEFEPSNVDNANKPRSNFTSIDSVNKDSLLELSPYPFDFTLDRGFLMNASLTSSLLPTYTIHINGQPFQALIDSGASANYIHPKLLKVVDSYRPVSNQAVETANGEQSIISGEATCTMEVKGEGKIFIKTFKAFVFESKFDIILGTSWLKQVKPKPDWFDSTWTITLVDGSTMTIEPYKKNINDQRKQEDINVIISAKQLNRLAKKNQISECYLVHASIDGTTVADKTGAQNFFSAFNYHYLLMVIAIVMKLY